MGCEESQVVTKAFRALGHEAYSCDIVDCSGGHPEWHIKDDVLNHLDDGWDLAIFHPDCTFLCIANSIHYDVDKWGEEKAYQRLDDQNQAVKFFVKLKKAPIERIVIENPLPLSILTMVAGKYDQIVHPYYFGDPFSKKTCLWLKNVPKLVATNMVSPGKMTPNKKGGTNPDWSHNLSPKDRKKIRSKTFQGIADAMAEQWN